MPMDSCVGRNRVGLDMVTVLGQLADTALLEAFVSDIVVRTYDGSENEALAANAALLGARRAGGVVLQPGARSRAVAS